MIISSDQLVCDVSFDENDDHEEVLYDNDLL